MKKRALAFSFVFLALLSLSFVSATPLEQTLTSIFNDYITPIVKFLLGGTDNFTGELVWVKLLVFAILLSAVYFATERIDLISQEAWVQWTITIAVSLLGARFLSTEALLNFVWLPTGVLGVTLICALPLVLYFFFVEEGFRNNRILRRFLWVLFIAIYAALAYLRWDDFSVVSDGKSFNLGWIYIVTAGIGTLSLIFDKTIQSMFRQVQAENSLSAGKSKHRIQLMKEYNDVHDAYYKATIPISKTDYNDRLDDLIRKSSSAGMDDLEKLFKGSKAR